MNLKKFVLILSFLFLPVVIYAGNNCSVNDDTDGGNSPKVFGEIIVDEAKICTDSCKFPFSKDLALQLLQECECITGKSQFKIVDCPSLSSSPSDPYLCHNGACKKLSDITAGGVNGEVQEPTETGDCTDEDDGDPYTSGVTTWKENDSVKSDKDHCVAGDSPDLIEVTCDGDTKIIDIITCENGCLDGACKEPVTCADPDADLPVVKVKDPIFDSVLWSFPTKYGQKSTTIETGKISKKIHKSREDLCTGDGQRLKEFYCKDDALEPCDNCNETVNCDKYDVDLPGAPSVNFVCQDGRCCPTNKICSDSDTEGEEDIQPDTAGTAMRSSCVEQDEPGIDTCGIAVCIDIDKSDQLDEELPEIVCPEDQVGGIITSNGEAGDYVKEYFCDGNKAYTAKVDYKWIKCESYQVCTDGACKNSYFGPTEFDEEDKSAKKTGKPNSPLQGIFVSPDGYAKYDTYESFCVKAEGPNFSYKVANGLNPDFFGEKGKAIRPEIYVYFEKLVCMWGCNGNGTRTDKNLDTNKGLCKPNPNVDTEMHIKKSSGRFMKFWNSFKKK